jgi:hypothetical protein
MATLGANAIRVYHVDSSGDHDGCMKAFEDAGIYLLVDLDTFNTAINPVSSTTPHSETILIVTDHRLMEPNPIQRLRKGHGRFRRLR